MKVYTASETYEIASEPFALGGGGKVYRIQGTSEYIIKILDKCDDETCRSLELLIKIQTKYNFSNVIMPLHIVNDQYRKPIGYMMKFIDVQYEFTELRDRRYLSNILKIKGDSYLFAIFYKLFETVKVLHNNAEYEIIICDLKPQNILVDKKDNVFIIDADSFKVIDRKTKKVLRNSTHKTVDYEHPSTVNNSNLLSTKTDIFGLIILGYEIITGINPYNVMLDKDGAYEPEVFKLNNLNIMFKDKISKEQNKFHNIKKVSQYLNEDFKALVEKALLHGSSDIMSITNVDELIQTLSPGIDFISSLNDINEVFHLDSNKLLKIYIRCKNIKSLLINNKVYSIGDFSNNSHVEIDYKNTNDYRVDAVFIGKNGIRINKIYDIQLGPPRLLSINNEHLEVFNFRVPWSGKVSCYIEAENVSFAVIDGVNYEVNKQILVSIKKASVACGKVTVKIGVFYFQTQQVLK